MVILIHVPNCDFVFFLSPHLFHVVQDISRLSCGKQLVCVGNAWSDERRAYSRCLRVKSFLRSSFCGIARCVVCQTPSRLQQVPASPSFLLVACSRQDWTEFGQPKHYSHGNPWRKLWKDFHRLDQMCKDVQRNRKATVMKTDFTVQS